MTAGRPEQAHLSQGTGGLLSHVLGAQARVAGRLARALAGTRAKTPLDLSQVRRVLVVHLFEIGDTVWLSPFLRELRRTLPQAEITLVVKPEAVNLVALCPYVNEVLPYGVRMRTVLRPFVLPWRAFWTARRVLHPRGFDLALVPSLLADNSYASFLAAFSGARWRVGYSETITDRRRRLNRHYDGLFTGTLDRLELDHDIRHNLAVIPFLGGAVGDESLEAWLGDEDKAFAESFLKERGVTPGEPLAAVCPTTGNSALKQWPLENYVRVARWLHEEKGMRVLVVGGPGDRALGAAFDALGPAVINAVGQTTLRQMAALVKRCRCFVGGDAGPTHLAPALQVPTVAVFGASCHHRAGPWGEGHAVVSHDIACSPCGAGHPVGADFRCPTCIFDTPRCMTGITPEEVQQAVARVLIAPARRLPLAPPGQS